MLLSNAACVLLASVFFFHASCGKKIVNTEPEDTETLLEHEQLLVVPELTSAKQHPPTAFKDSSAMQQHKSSALKDNTAKQYPHTASEDSFAKHQLSAVPEVGSMKEHSPTKDESSKERVSTGLVSRDKSAKQHSSKVSQDNSAKQLFVVDSSTRPSAPQTQSINYSQLYDPVLHLP
ncbi:uncharacterized protein LOC101858619, partial [Aplysia californica]|uniref:Uncharacterized protein LOC101858619 n=1 Tax=Aplysia californica TaxID=6500 RepID=A0ABM0ZX01_APLCA